MTFSLARWKTDRSASLDPRACYEALRSRDYRYDGHFFVAVRTTRIYCRPICPAKCARFENVTFYRTATEAEGQGYRPCRRCRPESAPGSPSWNGTSATVTRALRLIDEGYLQEQSVAQLAAVLGIGDRHLRTLFLEHVGVAPKPLADTRRLDFARKLIDSTRMPMSEIASSAGFSSVRRFNDSVKRRFRQTPSELRLKVGDSDPERGRYVIHLAYRPPYDWDWMMDYMRGHAAAGIEQLSSHGYARSFRTQHDEGWFRLTPEAQRHRVRVEIVASSSRDLMCVVQRIRRMFDLDADPQSVTATFGDGEMRTLIARNPGMRMPGAWDGFETSVRTIAGQVVSVRAAAAVTDRLIERFGDPMTAVGDHAPTRFFPAAELLAEESLEGLGLTRAKMRAIRELSQRVCSGQIVFDGIVDFDELRRQLQAVPGVGAWTADYVSLRLSDPDAFPRSDLVIARCLEKLGADGESWRPWRGYATHHLWRSYAEDREKYR